MADKGLLFIPDISGFSRFVSETEIGHSRLIIQELLEILINANQIGLEVSEIEGDAILFYKFGEPPALEALYKQVEAMFIAFHKNLLVYDNSRYCQCKACLSAVNLTLKVITHYGEFTGYNVKNFHKLIGKDLIVAHQLLKNDIDHHEYWLVTQNLVQGDKPQDFTTWMKWNNSIKLTETGNIPFQYTPLSPLKSDVVLERSSQQDLSEKTKVFSVTKDHDTDIITLFHASGDFQYRHRWLEGVKATEQLNHFLPRVGMRCRCTMINGDIVTYSSSYYQYQSDRIEFSETDEDKKYVTYYTLQRIDVKKTRLTLDIYITKDRMSAFYFRLFKKGKMEKALRRSMENLAGLVKALRIPSAVQA